MALAGTAPGDRDRDPGRRHGLSHSGWLASGPLARPGPGRRQLWTRRIISAEARIVIAEYHDAPAGPPDPDFQFGRWRLRRPSHSGLHQRNPQGVITSHYMHYIAITC